MSVDRSVKMRINVSGYAQSAASVFAAFDPDTDLLLIARSGPYETQDRPGYLRLTNQERDQHRDALFTEDDTRDAIVAFFEMEAAKLIEIDGRCKAITPTSKLERDGMDQNGMRYRVAPDISCGQVAVLIAALYASRQRAVGTTLEAMAEMVKILTI